MPNPVQNRPDPQPWLKGKHKKPKGGEMEEEEEEKEKEEEEQNDMLRFCRFSSFFLLSRYGRYLPNCTYFTPVTMLYFSNVDSAK